MRPYLIFSTMHCIFSFLLEFGPQHGRKISETVNFECPGLYDLAFASEPLSYPTADLKVLREVKSSALHTVLVICFPYQDICSEKITEICLQPPSVICIYEQILILKNCFCLKELAKECISPL